MMTLGVEKAFKLYMALRLHFTTDYNIFEHKGRFKNQSKVMSREDVYLVKGLIAIAKEPTDFVELCVANFLYGNTSFLYGQEYVLDNYKKWRKNKESITYQLQQDIEHINSWRAMGMHLDEYMAHQAISDLLSGKIQYESLIISQRYIPIFDMIRGYNANEFVARMKKANKFVVGGRHYDLHQKIVNTLKE
jgi:hypothetical protein